MYNHFTLYSSLFSAVPIFLFLSCFSSCALFSNFICACISIDILCITYKPSPIFIKVTQCSSFFALVLNITFAPAYLLICACLDILWFVFTFELFVLIQYLNALFFLFTLFIDLSALVYLRSLFVLLFCLCYLIKPATAFLFICACMYISIIWEKTKKKLNDKPLSFFQSLTTV